MLLQISNNTYPSASLPSCIAGKTSMFLLKIYRRTTGDPQYCIESCLSKMTVHDTLSSSNRIQKLMTLRKVLLIYIILTIPMQFNIVNQ